MAFIRTKRQGGRDYAYLVASHWDPEGQRTRQRVLRYLGPVSAVVPADIPAEFRASAAIQKWFKTHAPAAAERHAAALHGRREALADALLAADRPRIDAAVSQAITALGARSFILELLTPLLHKLGEDWYAGRISVADEHVMTRGVAEAVRTARQQLAAPSQDGARVLLANPEGENHALALEFLDCVLQLDGHDTVVTSGSTPRRDVASRAASFRADAVVVSATMPSHVGSSIDLARAVLERVPTAAVYIGGQAWGNGAKLAMAEANVQYTKTADELTDALRGIVEKRHRAAVKRAQPNVARAVD